MVVTAVRVPEVPVTVTVAGPVVAVALAVSVSRLVAAVGLGTNAAVTPLGKVDATRVTLPANPFTSVTVMVSVPLLPWATDNVVAEGVSVKLGGGLTLTVTAMLVDAVSAPEVPPTVTVAVPRVAVLLAVSVSTLLPVVGLGTNAAVTPPGKPDAARVTLPVNPFTSVTVIVSVALLPCVNARVDAEGASVKPGVSVPPALQVITGTAFVPVTDALNPIPE
jgi:hypothetical protein